MDSDENSTHHDAPSLDRVWGRLEEHIEQHKSELSSNRNIHPRRQTQAFPGARRQKAPERVASRVLTNIAAVLVVAVLLGSFVVVRNTLSHENKTEPVKATATAIPSSLYTITLVQREQEVTFTATETTIPLRTPVRVENQTETAQTMKSEGMLPAITIPAHTITSVVFDKAGFYTLSLNSNKHAALRVAIFDPDDASNRVTILKSNGQKNASQFVPTILQGGHPGQQEGSVVWKNESEQRVTVVCTGEQIPSLTIKPHGWAAMRFEQNGQYYCHLQENPGSVVLIQI